ncbi:hypothetical protein [Nonomuraea basaltis]|uniref:hypothetical protein n=1 Tax=Nonomuraea basaltis TaxID=2495887 RepID=UPI001F0D2906|nr:hypothetical protein [Nonomuraea basaltis]
MLTGPQRRGRPRVRPRPGHDRIGGQFLLIGLLQAQPRAEGHRLAGLGPPIRAKRLRPTLGPESGARRRRLAFRRRGQPQQYGDVPGPQDVLLNFALLVPAMGIDQRTVVAMQIEKRRHRAQHIRIGRRAQFLRQVRVNAVVHRGVPLRIPPAQIGLQHLTHHVVREQPETARLDERQPPQPPEQRPGVLRQGRPQQVLRRHVRVRADLQSMTMRPRRDLSDELVQQRGHHVPLRRPPPAGPAVLHRHRRPQQQRQGMPAGEGQQRLAQLVGHPAAVHQRLRVTGRQVAQRHHLQRPRPSGVGLPLHVRREPSRDHHQRAHRHPGQEPLP